MVFLFRCSYSPQSLCISQVALSTYRLLARGLPASPEDIAENAGRGVDEVKQILFDWSGIYKDKQGRGIGFWGLAIPKMRHRFELGGTQLYTWSAWDALFLPELLGQTAPVESICEQTGQPVRLTVSPDRVLSSEPATPFVSFLMPDACRFGQEIVKNFCHYVNFFRSREDGGGPQRLPGLFY